MEMKQDPERLQEWWKKKAVKPTTIQPKPASPLKEAAKVDLTRRPAKNPSAPPTAPAVASPEAAPDVEKAAVPGSGNSGQAGVGAPSIVATGKAAMNGPIFKFPSYLQNMENKISGQWLPPALTLQGEGVGAIIQFSVRKDGTIESVEVEQSSGNSFFDQAAMRAVYGAHPLPPLPEGLNEEQLKVHFSFTLQKGS